jgi:hypothetical protein
VLLGLAYLAVTNGLAMLRLLPMSDRTKDVEILALRHQLTVLKRQLHGQGHKVRFAPADRAFLAALLDRLPPPRAAPDPAGGACGDGAALAPRSDRRPPRAHHASEASRAHLAMDLKDDGRRAGFLIRDRDGKYPPLFDAILADTGITVVLAGVRMPRMSATPHHYRTDTRWMPSVTWCGRA